MRIWILFLTGCAATTGAGPSAFPTAAELQKLEAAPPPPRLSEGKEVDVARWQLTGPLPAVVQLDAHHGNGAWDDLLARAVDARHGLVFASEAMHCVAREVGRFWLAHQALPADALRRFIASRCGAVGGDVMTWSYGGQVAAGAGDDEIYSRWSGAVGEQLGKAVGTGSVTAGVWFGRQDDRAVTLVAAQPRQVELAATSLVPDAAGRVHLRGEVLGPADRIDGVVNRGRYGFAHCDNDPAVRLPRFELSCAVDLSDAAAWIEVGAFPAGRIVGRVVLSVLAWPTGAPTDAFDRPNEVAPQVAGADPAAQLVALLNQVRGQAALAPLELAPAESETAARVAPHYFAAMAGLESELVADQVVLGLRAGWNVGGTVRYGQFSASLVRDTDLGQLLAVALDRPSGREALLDGAVRKIAVGWVSAPEQRLLAATFSTYAFMNAGEPDGSAAQLFERLAAARTAAGRERPLPWKELSGVAAGAARSLGHGEVRPRQALDNLLGECSQLLDGAAVRGFFVEYASLDTVKLPPQLLSAARVRVAVGVAPYQPAGEPWARYGAFFVVDDAAATVASR